MADLLGKSRPYVSNTLALNKLPDGVKTELHRDGRNLSREILMGSPARRAPRRPKRCGAACSSTLCRCGGSGPNGAASRSGPRRSRDVFLAARRLNRALRLAWSGRRTEDRLPWSGVLRRSERLIQRQLKAIAES